MELQIGVQSLSLKYKNLLPVIWTSSFEYKDNRICDIVAEAS